ncbi:MAG: hypothetical protein J5661_02320, partial [Bacteroidaceae bacterium]|nr:hypothetical protein [Bacteroidaceae bacterium]
MLHALRASVPRHRPKSCPSKLDSPCPNTSEQLSASQHNQGKQKKHRIVLAAEDILGGISYQYCFATEADFLHLGGLIYLFHNRI